MPKKSQPVEKKKFIGEMLNNQLHYISPHRRLTYRDMNRIAKYINSSIFDDTECCIWNGYVTNCGSFQKGAYINFFFKNKKVALHRLLYENFIGPLGDDFYIKYTCDNYKNKGKCCNINHMTKYQYHSTEKVESIETITESNDVTENQSHVDDMADFTIEFN